MVSRYIRRPRFGNPAVARYFATIALVGFAFDGGIYAVLLNLFLIRLGYGPETIGLVNAAGTLTFALVSLPAGILGERWGSRQCMLLGLSLLGVGILALPLAELLAPGWRVGWLVVTISVAYLGQSLYFVNTAPYIMATIEADQRNRIFSFQTAFLSLAAFVGSLVGGFLPTILALVLGTSLEQPAPYRYALIVAGLAILPGILAIRSVQPNPRPQDAGETPVGAAGAATLAARIGMLLVLIAVVRTLQVAGLATITTFFNVYLDAALALPTAQIGTIIAVGRLLAVPAALATAPLAARFGNRAVVMWAVIGTALSILPLALIPHWTAASLSFIGVVGLSWIRYAASMVFFMGLVPASRRATMSGVTEMAAGICFTAVSFGGGYLIASFGYRSVFLAGAAFTALSALVFWRAFRSG